MVDRVSYVVVSEIASAGKKPTAQPMLAKKVQDVVTQNASMSREAITRTSKCIKKERATARAERDRERSRSRI